MSQALATKYRPQTFESVCAQNSIIKILQKQLETNQIKNAYLFCGASGCVDKDTEFFTGYGWKKISDYTEGDKVLQYNPANGNAELVMPLRYIKEECHKFNHFHTKYGVDMMLSDDHTVVYKIKNKIHTKLCSEVKELQNSNVYGFSGKFITTFNYNGEGISLTDAEIKVMCAVISDGSFKLDSKSNRCYINIKKDRKISELKSILTEAEIPYEITQKTNGYSLFKFNSPRREKEFGSYWYKCNNHQLNVICDNILKWDGYDTPKHKQFSQCNQSTLNFVQFAFSSCGHRATICTTTRRSRVKTHVLDDGTVERYYYPESNESVVNITCNSRNEVSLGKSSVLEIESIDGYKYCFTVPTHMWIMRRNGRICVTGNCGKTTVARIFAREINQGVGAPIEIDGASNNGVENVRNIISSASARALDGKYKVYIIDEVHALSSNAWQAFLKCIEEPPEYTVFIFCTTDPQKIPATILNRVMRFNFTRINTVVIKQRLEFICDQEQFINYLGACDYISRIAQGSMRQAISLLDKAAAYNTDLDIANVLVALGGFSYDTMFKLLNAIIDGNEAEALSVIDEVFNSGLDLKLFISQFLAFCLDVNKYLLFQDITMTSVPSLMENNMKSVINFKNPQTYYSYLVNKVLDCKNYIKNDADYKSSIEVYILNMCRCI